MTIKELKQVLTRIENLENENVEVKVMCKESSCAEKITEVLIYVKDPQEDKPIVEIHYD